MSLTADVVSRRDVRDWVESLPPGTFFHLDAVPGTARLKRVVLSLMSSQPNARLKRAARGIYQWSRHRDQDGTWLPEKGVNSVIKLHAGRLAGSGWSGLSAEYKLGWVHQVPVYLDVAVLRDRNGNIPVSPLPYVTYHSRSNRRRQELNWAEVTVLEGLRSNPILGNRQSIDRHEWEWAMEQFTHGFWWDNYASKLRLDVIRWAIDTEPAKHLNALHRGFSEVVAAVERKRATDDQAESPSRADDANQPVP